MAENLPKTAGWYPDPATGGTRYFSGRYWTGDVRPVRRPFAAPAAYRGWGIALVIVGPLFLITSPSQLMGTAADPASPGAFVVALLLGCGGIAVGIYLLRGQGPTTKAVVAQLRDERVRDIEARAATAGNPGVVVNVAGSNDSADAARVAALSDPKTAMALQNLQKLLYTRTISDDEFRAAKAKLFGNERPAGSAGQSAPPAADDLHQAKWSAAEPILVFPAEIGDAKTTMSLFEDRLETKQKGIRRSILRLQSITNVDAASRRGRTTITIRTARRALTLQVKRADSDHIVSLIDRLAAAAGVPATPKAVTVNVNTPTAPSAPAATSGPDLAAHLVNLAQLHTQGVLSDAEFAAAKARALQL